MKIIHTLWSLGFGGIERLALDLATIQMSNGNDVAILTGQKTGELVSLFTKAGLIIHSLDLIHGWDFTSTKISKGSTLMSQFDIIHIHSYNPAIAKAAQLSEKPIIYTEHGNFGFGRKKTWRDRIKKILLSRFLTKHVQHLTFNSYFSQKTALQYYPTIKTPQSVIYNGVDGQLRKNPDSRLPAAFADLMTGKFVVGTSSRFAGVKRLDRLIDGFARFPHRNDSILLLVGDGVLANHLAQRTRQLGIDKLTLFTGFQSNVVPFQNAMDVCVFPSERESFGLVAIESFALGKPTIVFFDGGGIVEIVKPLEPDDVVSDLDGFVDRLTYYYHHRTNFQLSARRRKYADNFSIDTMALALHRIYEGISKSAATES